jgi:hypothetical protein
MIAKKKLKKKELNKMKVKVETLNAFKEVSDAQIIEAKSVSEAMHIYIQIINKDQQMIRITPDLKTTVLKRKGWKP